MSDIYTAPKDRFQIWSQRFLVKRRISGALMWKRGPMIVTSCNAGERAWIWLGVAVQRWSKTEWPSSRLHWRRNLASDPTCISEARPCCMEQHAREGGEGRPISWVLLPASNCPLDEYYRPVMGHSAPYCNKGLCDKRIGRIRTILVTWHTV